MPWPIVRDAALDRLLSRAFVLWALVRVGFVMIALAGRALTGIGPSQGPIGIILLCGLVGLIDVQRRGERALWANLGTPSHVLFLIGCAAAVPGEIVLFLVR